MELRPALVLFLVTSRRAIVYQSVAVRTNPFPDRLPDGERRFFSPTDRPRRLLFVRTVSSSSFLRSPQLLWACVVCGLPIAQPRKAESRLPFSYFLVVRPFFHGASLISVLSCSLHLLYALHKYFHDLALHQKPQSTLLAINGCSYPSLFHSAGITA